MPVYDFSAEVVFVTGAARGQGRSHAIRFAESGADVVVTDVDAGEDLQETANRVESAGGSALVLEMDVSDRAAVVDAVDSAVAEFGRLDVLVNNAGVLEIDDSRRLDEAAWDRVLEVNLKGTWLCSAAAGAQMSEQDGGGRIVNISSIAGLVGFPGSAHYASSKHGVVGLTKTLAVDFGQYDIAVNAVCPGSVGTDMLARALADADAEDAVPDFSQTAGTFNLLDEGDAPLEPGDVTEAVVWLASDAARYVTGVALPVDAGYTAK
jgi:NAD(P)-dependent dehydrogenase (short-subunit alcohol dehydrogenase family)